MCGRFTITQLPTDLAEQFDVEIPDSIRIDFNPRYNLAPTQPVLVVRTGAEGGRRELTWLRWGLIPSWAKDPAIGNRMINARAESLADKPAYRASYRRRRCLVLADGFYEWQRRDRVKQPYYLRFKSGGVFGLAGLWEHWQSPDGDELESCAIITTDPNALASQIHDRMPVIIPGAGYDRWLDPRTQSPDALAALLKPYPADQMESYPVSTNVNRPANDSAENIRPLDDLFGMDI